MHAKKILHVLSQRPSLTGSGVTLVELARQAAFAGWEQQAVIGVPSDDPSPPMGALDSHEVHPLVFGTDELNFKLPGMSDVMPYPSTVFSQMTSEQLCVYREAWRRHLAEVVADFKPDIIHSNHVWIMSSILKDIAPDIPVLTHCHATGLRQMSLCPHLAEKVQAGCRRNEHFFVVHDGHAEELSTVLNIDRDRVHVVSAGYREDLFHLEGRGKPAAGELLYVGKYSQAKGLPQLLDALEQLSAKHPAIRLHIAGSGAGTEADALKARMKVMAPMVKLHGMLDHHQLSDLMRRCHACILPSFYEGLPLVLVEAAACGCRLVSTELPGVVRQLRPQLADLLELVPLPRMQSLDVPLEEDLPAFVNKLSTAIETVMQKSPASELLSTDDKSLDAFTWKAVFRRVERVWREVAG